MKYCDSYLILRTYEVKESREFTLKLIRLVVPSFILFLFFSITANAYTWNKVVTLEPSDTAFASVDNDYKNYYSSDTAILRCTVMKSGKQKAIGFSLEYANQTNQINHTIPSLAPGAPAIVSHNKATFENTPEGDIFLISAPKTFQAKASYDKAGNIPWHQVAMRITNTYFKAIKISCNSEYGKDQKLIIKKVESNFNHG